MAERIEEDVAGVVDQAGGNRCDRAAYPVAVGKVLDRYYEQDMPEIAGPVFLGMEGDFMTLKVAFRRGANIEDESHLFGMAGKDGEIDALIEGRDTLRQGAAPFHGDGRFLHGHE